jgi:hypothetical protein
MIWLKNWTRREQQQENDSSERTSPKSHVHAIRSTSSKKMSGLAQGRLTQERLAWRKDHPPVCQFPNSDRFLRPYSPVVVFRRSSAHCEWRHGFIPVALWDSRQERHQLGRWPVHSHHLFLRRLSDEAAKGAVSQGILSPERMRAYHSLFVSVSLLTARSIHQEQCAWVF